MDEYKGSDSDPEEYESEEYESDPEECESEEDPEECESEEDSEERGSEEDGSRAIRVGFPELLRRLRRPKFDEDGGSEEAGRFLDQLDKDYHQYECTPGEGVMMAEYRLEGRAKAWWEFVREWEERCSEGNVWEIFRQAFINEYAPSKVGNAEPILSIPTTQELEDQVQNEKKRKSTVDNPEGTRRPLEISGLITVNGHQAHALFDTGATNSTIDEEFVQAKGLTRVRSGNSRVVIYADGSRRAVTYMCEGCQVIVGEIDTIVSLTVTPIRTHDVIIGMDWLSTCYAHIDCRKREIVFKIPGRSTYTFSGQGGNGKKE